MNTLNMSPVGLIVCCHEKPCRECGSIDSIIGNGDGQAFEMVCAVRDAHRGRPNEKTLSFIVGIIRQAGRPTEPIILRIVDIKAENTTFARRSVRGLRAKVLPKASSEAEEAAAASEDPNDEVRF
jgi:hypothetical protein